MLSAIFWRRAFSSSALATVRATAGVCWSVVHPPSPARLDVPSFFRCLIAFEVNQPRNAQRFATLWASRTWGTRPQAPTRYRSETMDITNMRMSCCLHRWQMCGSLAMQARPAVSEAVLQSLDTLIPGRTSTSPDVLQQHGADESYHTPIPPGSPSPQRHPCS